MDLARAFDKGEDFYVLHCEGAEHWKHERLKGITASEAAALWAAEIADVTDGEQSFSWESPYSLWTAKLGASRDFDEDNELLYWGQVLEPIIADEYARRFGRALEDWGRHALLVSRERPHLRATLDRVILDTGDGRGPGVLECKNTSAFLLRHWSDGRPPERVWAQVQHQLAVTGWSWGVAAALLGGSRYLAVPVLCDDEWITEHLRRVDDLWARVVSGEAPPTDGSDATARALAARWRTHQPVYREPTEEAVQRFAALEQAREVGRAAEKDEKEHKNWLREFIGDASGVAGVVELKIEAGRVSHAQITEALLAKLPPEEAAKLTEAARGEPVKKLTKWKPARPGKRK